MHDWKLIDAETKVSISDNPRSISRLPLHNPGGGGRFSQTPENHEIQPLDNCTVLVESVKVTMEFIQEFGREFERLEKIPGLQRKDWELNQSGVDRGIEAVLIQRTPREIATYALVQLRFSAMPELRAACSTMIAFDSMAEHLVAWAETQKPRPSIVLNVITSATEATDCGRVAALSTLSYYRRREDDNRAVKAPWTAEGLSKLPSIDVGGLLRYPTPDNIFWRGKYDTAQRLAGTVLAADLPQMSDDEVVNVLREIEGIGPQTASMVALFWLERAVPVVDNYLLRLLRHYDHWKVWLESGSGEEELRRNLIQWARKTERERAEWSAKRSLASLYLWACEIGRSKCICGNGPSPNANCPVVTLLE